MHASVTPALLTQLRELLGSDGCFDDPAETLGYSYDNSKRQAAPDMVLLPQTALQVAGCMKLLFAAGVPLTARGRGSNTTGASVPVSGGAVMSFERMRRIVSINAEDRYAVVEPGVLNGDLQQVLADRGFFWPPDPTSAPYCTIGGNLACNAGGPRAVKYGACRENVLALQAVDGRGRLFRCGNPTTKGAAGFDVTRLLVGSEGTLALITEATLRLVPLPAARAGLRLLYARIEDAAAAVARIMAQPVTPCALEFMDATALGLLRERGIALPIADAMLLVEVDGRPEALPDALAAVVAAARGAGLVDLIEAADAGALQQVWAARKALSPALRSLAPKKINEDVVVPVSRLPELIDGLLQLSRRYDILIVNFGHAGNGNIHVNLMFDPAESGCDERAAACLDAVFALVISLDGTLSGEHGIGLAKRDFMPRAIDPVTLDLMRSIKRQFDPAGLLNPQKLLPPNGAPESGNPAA